MRRVAGLLALVASMAAGAFLAPVAQAADPCPNAAYRHGSGANLTECRAWEQVTPVDKAGFPPVPGLAAYGTDGGRVLFFANGSLGGESDAVPFQPFFSGVRGSSWTTLGADPPADSPTGPYFNLFPRGMNGFLIDGTKTFVSSPRALTPGAVEDASNLYLRDTATGSYSFLATVPGRELYNSLTRLGGPSGVIYGASTDLSHVVLNLPAQDSIPNSGGLFDAHDGQLTRVDGDANGNPSSGGPGPTYLTTVQPEVSQDGRRVTFSGNPGLFQRVDRSTTVSIARSRRPGADPSPVGVGFGGGWPSADGTRVIFATFDPTANLTTDGPGPFYVWSADGGADGTLRSLFAGITPPWGANSQSFSLLGVSNDGRYVFFTYRDGSTGDVPIQVLDRSTKKVSTKVTLRGVNQDFGSTFNYPRFSPDGTKMLVGSGANVTGYDQNGPACTGAQDGRCTEVFLIDAETGDAPPVCVSCGAAGTVSAGNAGIGTSDPGYVQPWSVTNDGRAYFDTPQRLSPADANNVSDVYEYVPGRGAALISSGTGSSPSGLLSGTPSHDDVFFFTQDRLVAQDDDNDTDVYDARVGGGLAAQQVARASTVVCASGNCPGPQASAPGADSPPTATFQGQAKRPRFSVSSVSSAARRAAAASGRLKVTASVGAAGRLSARASGRMARRSVVIGRSSATVHRAGRVTLTLALSRAARRALARNGRLAIELSVSYSRAPKSASQAFSLTRTRGSTKGGAR